MMRIKQLSPVWMVILLAGCDKPIETEEKDLSPEVMSSSQQPVDSISARQPDTQIHNLQDFALKRERSHINPVLKTGSNPPADTIEEIEEEIRDTASDPAEPINKIRGDISDRVLRTLSNPVVANTIEEIEDDIVALRQLAVNAPKPKARIRALKALAPRASENAEAVLPAFEEAITDNNQEVRGEALEMIYKTRLNVPSDMVHDVAVTDPVDEVRGMAWIVLVERSEPELRAYLADALNDPNPLIRRDAQWEINKLDYKTQ